MNFAQVDTVTNPPDHDHDMEARHEGAVASSSAAPPRPSRGSSSAVPPQATAAAGVMPPDPVSAGSRHRGGRTSRPEARSTPRSLSPPGTEPVSSGPRDMGILLSSDSGSDSGDRLRRRARGPSPRHVGQGSGGTGQSEESHGGGGPSALPSRASHPTLPSQGPDEDLSNLVNVLNAHNLLGHSSLPSPNWTAGAADAGPSSMRVDLQAAPPVEHVTRPVVDTAVAEPGESSQQQVPDPKVFTRRATSVGGQPIRSQVIDVARRGRGRGRSSVSTSASPDSPASRGRSSASVGRARTPSRRRAPVVSPQDVPFPESAAELDRPNEALSPSPSAGDGLKRKRKKQG